MNSETRRPRTRGGSFRRGRGVRVRGGRGGPVGAPPLWGGVVEVAGAGGAPLVWGVMDVVEAAGAGGAPPVGGVVDSVEVAGVGGTPPVGGVVDSVEVAGVGGAPPARGRRAVRVRGGRAAGPSGSRSRGSARQARPGPHYIEELDICDIRNLPEGRALETALHPKRRRVWQRSVTVRPAGPPPALTLGPPQHPSTTENSVPSPTIFLGPPSPTPSAHSVPSPAMFVECGEGSASLVQRPPPSCRRLNDGEIADQLNYGSEPESDESDDEEPELRCPMIPRAFRSELETPLDRQDGPAWEPQPAPIIAGGVPAADVPTRATEQPWSAYDFDWRAFPRPPISPESRREAFSQINVGPTSPSTDPYDIFIEIWDRHIMEYIASETNKYAQQMALQLLESHNLYPRSRIGQWRDTTVDELYIYFGIILAMGIVVKSKIEEYWSVTPDIFYTPGFSAHMSIDRFLLLSRCLHFNDNENMCTLELENSEAKLFKIMPILLHLNNKFQSMYTMAQNIALDESLLMWKGWLEFSQLLPNKAAQRGIKTYEVCESQTGYLWRFEVHTGKKSPPQNVDDPLQASTPSTVLRLLQGLEHKGYTVWMDNFYNSPTLARRLKSLGFDCVGTLRTDRKFVPGAISHLTRGSMPQGQITGLTSGDVDVMVWRDANRVAMISTYHGNGQQTTQGSTKPILILDYNIMMGGVDKKDQLLALYPIERKRTRVWYKKFFRRLLNVSVLNAYIIHKHNTIQQHTQKLAHRDFRTTLIKQLLSTHHSSPLPIRAPATTQKVDLTHRIAEYPMGKSQRLRRACTECKKQVHTFCVGCSKTVCIDPCFIQIHS